MFYYYLYIYIYRGVGGVSCIIFQPFCLTCSMLNFHLRPLPSYLPVLVSTIRALAQHLKEDSTAPTATASEGSRVRRVERLSSSNSCLWNMAASASRAIWQHRPVEGGGREGLYSIILSTTQTERNSERDTWARMFMLVLYSSKALEQSFCYLNKTFILLILKWINFLADGHQHWLCAMCLSHFSLSSSPLLSLLFLLPDCAELVFHIISMSPAYLPDPVRTINAEARILKEASTAPMAMASAGSVEWPKQRRRSSNTCRWNMAASASRAIWCSPREIRQAEHSRETERYERDAKQMRQEGVKNRGEEQEIQSEEKSRENKERGNKRRKLVQVLV